jgi:Na+-driven multidrug efflux pump
MWRILRIGLPAAADGAIMWTGHFLFLKLIAWTGSSAGGPINYAFAAHMVVVRLEAFTYLPANAWAAACATMLGQALGAGLPQRARLVGREAALQAGCVAAVIGLGFIVFARPLCALMHEDPHVVDQAAGVLRMIGAFEPVLALTIVYMGALRGAGDTVFPLFFTAFGLALVRLPVSYLLALYLGWGLRGAWLGVSADLLVRMTLAWTRFRRGRWVATKV